MNCPSILQHQQTINMAWHSLFFYGQLSIYYPCTTQKQLELFDPTPYGDSATSRAAYPCQCRWHPHKVWLALPHKEWHTPLLQHLPAWTILIGWNQLHGHLKGGLGGKHQLTGQLAVDAPRVVNFKDEILHIMQRGKRKRGRRRWTLTIE